jgi:polyhydroxyalkanoate synthesis regulator phasin
MPNIIRATFYAGVGLVDKLREEIDELVRRGELKKQEGEELLEAAEEESRSRMKELQEKVERAVRVAVDKLPPVALRNDVAGLEARIAELESRLKAIQAGSEQTTDVSGD